MQTRNILICVCNSHPVIDKEKAAFLAAVLHGKEENVQLCPDLFRIMERREMVKELEGTTILACYPRAIRSLFKRVGAEPGEILDIRSHTREEILDQLHIAYPIEIDTTGFVRQIAHLPAKLGTDAWYPVIDKERCGECGKCYDFCLFGVYTVEKDRVKVTNPQNCKNNCPACARICPAKAIIFPRYERSPINGGTEEEEQAISLDTQAVYNDALRMRLKHRRNSISLLKKDKL
ncbi:MAG: ferredoxin family protein [Bacteroides sp.]|nr:ferredoxin family protein [Bacteroides sp.]